LFYVKLIIIIIDTIILIYLSIILKS